MTATAFLLGALAGAGAVLAWSARSMARHLDHDPYTDPEIRAELDGVVNADAAPVIIDLQEDLAAERAGRLLAEHDADRLADAMRRTTPGWATATVGRQLALEHHDQAVARRSEP